MKGNEVSKGEIKTIAGTVRGVETDGVWAFKGVPYGADTSGDGRFRPARPPQPWTGVRDCVEYGPSVPQMTIEQMLGVPVREEAESLMGTHSYERVMGEDCLALNVWTPAVGADSALPVVVWLHGGGWSTGSASWPLYDFSNLARHGNVVAVGINHRVGILGFLDVSRLGDEFADSGNVGMLDVVSALEWIRDNIAGFGGDPGSVTVFGESGGGAKVATLLGMPAGRGLFHKAVAMSGSMLIAQEPADAAINTDAVLERLGIGTDTAKLAALDVAALIEAEVELPGRNASGLMRGRVFSPVLGPSLPQHPDQAIRAGVNADVRLVSGCTHDETLGFLFADPDLWTLDDVGVLDRLRPFLGDDAERLFAAYRAGRPDDSPTTMIIAITTDAAFRLPQISLADAHVEGGGAATYVYEYRWGFEDPTGRVVAPHGTDMPYWFDNVDVAAIAAGPHADDLVAMMSGALVGLAHTGAPDNPALPSWPPYTLDERAMMHFDVPARIEHDSYGAEREWWSGIVPPGFRGS